MHEVARTFVGERVLFQTDDVLKPQMFYLYTFKFYPKIRYH